MLCLTVDTSVTIKVVLTPKADGFSQLVSKSQRIKTQRKVFGQAVADSRWRVHVSELQVATRSCVTPQLTASKEMETLMVQPQKMNSVSTENEPGSLIASQSFWGLVGTHYEGQLMVSRNFSGFCEDGSSDKDTSSVLKAHCVSGAVLTTRNTLEQSSWLMTLLKFQLSCSESQPLNLSMVLNGLKIFKGGILRTCSPLKVKVVQLA